MSRPVGVVSKPGGSKVNKTGTWKTMRPVFLHENCDDCRICVMVCPDGVIFGSDSNYNADLDYCKGCGICARECPKGDIEMVLEVK